MIGMDLVPDSLRRQLGFPNILCCIDGGKSTLAHLHARGWGLASWDSFGRPYCKASSGLIQEHGWLLAVQDPMTGFEGSDSKLSAFELCCSNGRRGVHGRVAFLRGEGRLDPPDLAPFLPIIYLECVRPDEREACMVTRPELQ